LAYPPPPSSSHGSSYFHISYFSYHFHHNSNDNLAFTVQVSLTSLWRSCCGW
jgi:hypothetical protein